MSTGAAKHSSLPYGTPGAEQTHIHTAKQGEVAHPIMAQGVCVCVCDGWGEDGEGQRGSIVSDWKAEVLGGGEGKSRGS